MAGPSAAVRRRRPGRPAGVLPSPSERRELLLAAAERAIAEHGPDVSMELIAQSAGVSKPTLYDNFDGKSGLTTALCDRFTLRLLDALAASLQPQLTAEQIVQVGVAALLEEVDRQPEAFRYLVRHSGPDELLGEVRVIISGILTTLLDTQGLDPSIAPLLTTAGIAGLLSAAEQWCQERSTPRSTVQTALADFIWGGALAVGVEPDGDLIDLSGALDAIATSPLRGSVDEDEGR